MRGPFMLRGGTPGTWLRVLRDAGDVASLPGVPPRSSSYFNRLVSSPWASTVTLWVARDSAV